MKRLGMTIPLQTLPLSEHAAWVRELQELGYSDVWTSEAQDVDGLVPLALASQWAPALRLGCACLPVQTRGPGTLAMGIAALCDTAPGRVVAGVGCSSEPIVRYWNALPFEKPSPFRISSMRACSPASSCLPRSWISSGVMSVVVEARRFQA